MRWPYGPMGTQGTKSFRNLLNKIFGDIEADMKEQSNNLNSVNENLNKKIDQKETESKNRDTNIQNQVNELVVNGDSSPQAAQASVGADGTDYDGNLKARLDAEYNLMQDYKNGIHRLLYKTVSTTVTNTKKPGDYEYSHLAFQGADTVLCVMVGVSSETDPVITMMLDDPVIQAINSAGNNGVKVQMLKPHIGINFSDGFDRGKYLPSDIDAFFSNWKTVLLHYAALCHENNIPILCISCEQRNQTLNIYESKWQNIYNSIKALYPNLLLTHAPKGYEWNGSNINFYKWCDIIGMNIYLNYTHKEFDGSNITVQDIAKRFYWIPGGTNVHDKINYLSVKFNKPVFITEIGSMPQVDGLIDVISEYAWDSTRNYDIVALHMEAVFANLCNNQNVIGVSWWHTQTPFDYFKDGEVTSAEAVVKKYFDGGIL